MKPKEPRNPSQAAVNEVQSNRSMADETAIDKSAAPALAQDELRTLHEQLEARVRERTTALEAEVAEHRRIEDRDRLAHEVLLLLNHPTGTQETMREILRLIKHGTGFEAVGIRLRKGDDFPYFVQDGFSSDFLRTENTLMVPACDGGNCRDKDGNIPLACTCGLVISGRTDPANSLFTPDGSSWTNDLFPWLDLPAAQDPRLHPRNRCSHEGFHSVGLIPLRIGREIIGLLQLNDRRPNQFTPEMIRFLEGLGASIGIALSRRQAVEALRSRETHYRSLFENMLNGFAYCRMLFDHEQPQDFIYLEVNRAFVSLTGLKNVVGRKVSEVIPGIRESDPALFEIYGRVALTGQPERFENYVAPLKMWFSVSVYSPEKEYFVAIFDVVTERKQTEEKIREQAALLDQTSDAILVHALAGGITFWNRGAEHLFGWTAQQALGRQVKEIMAPADPRGQVGEDDRQVIEQGYWQGEMNYVTKTGQKLIGLARATLVRDAAGKPQSILVLITDLTEQKKLEKQFLRAQRLEAVGTLAGGIAHDLNNILSPILMGAPFLRNLRTPAEMAPTLIIIEACAQRAADVVRQLLTFSRGQSGERITMHLKHLLGDLRNIIRETFPKNIAFTCAESPNLWPLVADPTQLHQILLNLCINARDAMPAGGTLAVTTANFTVDDQFASMVTGARPGAYIHLQVKDTGSGIQPEYLDKIFDPFFTTKEVGRGTGLGLATVHKVVTGHDGFVQVSSQVGQGTAFDIYLPASPAAVATAEPAPIAPAPAGQGELILVVDDEEGIRKITQKTLVLHGYRTVTAADGAAAIAVFAQHQAEVKAVVSDLMMPVMDGLVLVQVLAQMKPGLPVVISTGLSDDPEQAQKLAALRRLGVGAILTKPYTAGQLQQALHALLQPPG